MLNVGINLWKEAKSTNDTFEPINVIAPVITDDPDSVDPPAVGDVLTVSNGVWIANPAITAVHYEWIRATDPDDSMTWIDIGTDSDTYTIVEDDVANYIFCIVSATNAVDTVSKHSNIIGPVNEAVFASFNFSAFSSAFNK